MIDKSRAELLSGAPDAPPIDDLRNLFQLCPNHHTSFDRYEWTLVEERREKEVWASGSVPRQCLCDLAKICRR